MQNRYYFPKPKKAEHLYVINKSGMSDYEKILLASIQGVTAKNKPCIWISGVSPSYDIWLDDMKKRHGVTTEDVSDLYTLLGMVKDQISGYILCDLSDHTSLNVATSLAGIKRAVIADIKIEDKVKEFGFECLFDACGLDDNWTYENYHDKFGQGEDLLSDEIMLEQRAHEGDERYYTLRDYAIFCNMATVYQGSSPLLDKFLRCIKNDTLLLGWGDDTIGEDNMGIAAVKNGTVRIASDWAANLTVLASLEEENLHQFTETPEDELEDEENVHYVTFLWTDGDNIQWTNGGFATNETFWASPARGKFNVGWGLNNVLLEASPSTLHYYYETASNTENAKDYFVVGPHLAYASYFHDTLPVYTEHLNDMMGRMGMKYVNINELGTILARRDAFRDYTEHENIEGLFYIEYCKYDYWKGRIEWSNGKPIVTARFAVWDPKQMDNATPDDVVRKLNAMPADPHSPDGYSYVTVHAWSGYNMETIYEMTKKLNDNIRVVTPDEFMKRIKKNLAPINQPWSERD